jgi:hypothetical protein
MKDKERKKSVDPWQQEQNQVRARTTAFLSEDQRNKLAAAAGVLQRSDAGTELVSVGAITCAQWLCSCSYRVREEDVKLGLNSAQLAQLEELRVAQGMVYEERKKAVLDILDSAQRAKLASFETDLRIVDQAIELGLLPRRRTGEYPCHK